MSQEQVQLPKVMNIQLTVDEAQLILNKLNTASFIGFTEASQAVTVFSKIKGAPQVPMQASPPPIGTVKEDPNFGPRKMIDKGDGYSVKKFTVPVTNDLGDTPKESAPPIQEEKPVDDGPTEDTRPGAPMMQVNTPKPTFKQPFSEDKQTGDLVFDGKEDLEVGEEKEDPSQYKDQAPVKHTSPVGTTIIEGGTLTDNDDIPPSEPDPEESAFSVVNHTTSAKIVEHPNPELEDSQALTEEKSDIEEEKQEEPTPLKSAASEYL